MAANSKAAQLRSDLGHPVIDADGHWLEVGPIVASEMQRIGGDKAYQGFTQRGGRVRKALAMSVQERKESLIAQEAFWGAPAKNTLDRATAMMPKLLYERLDEFGVDFAVIYPTAGLSAPRIDEADLRKATCRAFNIYTAEVFSDFSDRMTPAAVIPMHTPDEAIEEMQYVTEQLGLKVAMFMSMIPRPLETIPDSGQKYRFDMLGLDSDYNYDAVWSACETFKISPTFHRGSRGLALRTSPSNFVYNHIGHFAAASDAVLKSLFLAGVTRRFPNLKMAFLEGGVAWACQLYADLIGHWNIRNKSALEEVKPGNLDAELLLELAEKYDGGLAELVKSGRGFSLDSGPDTVGNIEELDDYAACEIKTAADIKDLFAESFYFGCEADDCTNAWAFNTKANPYGAKLKAMFGSDIGHFDVVDMSEVLLEAYELVEDDLMTKADFKDFTFTNAVRFWGSSNPEFFKGTAVEAEAAEVLTAA